jgi:cytochrome b involved in lipid metabolism
MHKRLLHASASKMKHMYKAADGVKQMLNMEAHTCTVCAETKQKRTNIPKTPIPPASKPLERVHIDLVGPFPKSIRGFVSSCIITDSYTRRRWALHIKLKSDAYSSIAKWAEAVEAQINLKIKYIRCDRGGEFDSNAFKAWADCRGYIMEYTAPGSSFQNGVAERSIGVLLPSTRAIMKNHNVPKDWWCIAMDHVYDVTNMMPASVNSNKSPMFMWNNKVADVSKLRVFGCLAYAHIDTKKKLPKLSATAVPCVYIGHPTDGEGYKLWNWLTDKIIICRSVEFFEGQSGFKVPEAKSYIKHVAPELL